MNLIAQVELATEQIMEAIGAAKSRGWEAVVLVMVILTGGSLLVWIVKTWMNQAESREKALVLRLQDVENFIRVDMKDLAVRCQSALEKNMAMTETLIDVLENRPCFWSPEKQNAMIDDCKCRLTRAGGQ